MGATSQCQIVFNLIQCDASLMDADWYALQPSSSRPDSVGTRVRQNRITCQWRLTANSLLLCSVDFSLNIFSGAELNHVCIYHA